MPGPEPQQPMPDLPDDVYGEQEGLSRSGSPDWGGVDLKGGDNADATGGPDTAKDGTVAG